MTKKRFYPISIVLMLAAGAGYLLTGVTGAFDQPGFGLREIGVGLLSCLYTYGAGAFLYARRERLLAWKLLSDERVKQAVQA